MDEVRQFNVRVINESLPATTAGNQKMRVCTFYVGNFGRYPLMEGVISFNCFVDHKQWFEAATPERNVLFPSNKKENIYSNR